jgi:hypothetical protein
MIDRRFVAFLAVAVAFSGCHGAGGGAGLPPVSPRGALAPHRSAATVSFTSLGPTHMADPLPTSGKVNAFVQNPSNPSVMYVASGRGTGLETYSSAGIYRTADGGKTWQASVDGLTGSDGTIASVVNALWLDASNPSVLLAATEYDGIFRSSNGGTSWNSVYRTTAATQIVSYGKLVFAATAAGILQSADAGKTWTVAMPGTAARYPSAFGAVEGTQGNALYAGMTDGSIYAYAGNRWSKRGKLPYDAHTGTYGSVPAVHQIAVDPVTPSMVYASSNDGRWDQDLHASLDGGRTWNSVLKKKYYDYGLGTQAIAFSTVHPHRLFIGADGALYYITANGSPTPTAFQAANVSVIDIRNIWTAGGASDDTCWIASDQGLDEVPSCSTYTQHLTDNVVSASSATGLARHFTVSPNGKQMLVSLQDFGSHYTGDGGAHWTDHEDLYEDGFNELRPGRPNVCYAYDEASGLSISNDGCQTFFTSRASHLYPSRLMTTPIAFDPKNPLTMYVASGVTGGVGFPPSPHALFVSANGGTSFTELKSPMAAPGSIAVDARNGAHMLAGDLRKGASSIYASFDTGKTWKKASGVVPTAFWYALTVSPVNGNVVLASSVDAANNVFVLRSSDGGRHFTRISTVTNAPLLRGRIDARHHMGRGGADEDAGGATESSQAFVYSPEREIRYDQDVKTGTASVVITTLRGAFLSNDDGSTWSRLDGKLIAHSFWSIRWLDGYLYLASDGQGVLRSRTPVDSRRALSR